MPATTRTKTARSLRSTTYLPETKSGTPGADSVKVEGNLHWVSAAHACAAEIRLYDRLFAVPAPAAGAGDAPERAQLPR